MSNVQKQIIKTGKMLYIVAQQQQDKKTVNCYTEINHDKVPSIVFLNMWVKKERGRQKARKIEREKKEIE